ncbi:MAG: putative glycoside hydrolase [Acidimicrobiia bacterium]
MRVVRKLLLLSGLVLAACSGPSLVVVGEGVPPAPAIPELEVVVTDNDGDPIPAAEVAFGDLDNATADDGGRAMTEWPRRPLAISASAAGFHPGSVDVLELPDTRVVELSLDPVILSGVVRTAAGHGLPGALVSLGETTTLTDFAGRFTVERAVPGPVVAHKASYEGTTVEWDGAGTSIDLDLQPRMIRSIRASGPAAGDSDRWGELLDLAETTEINAIVVDTKDESGRVFYETSVATAHEIGAVTAHYVPAEVLADLRERDLYAITRIVTFQDRYMGAAYPEHSVWDAGTNQSWTTGGGEIFMDSTDPGSWDYPLALAEEACRLGYDEIQFDYVRFPTDGPVDRAVYDGPSDQAGRVITISSFLSEARARLNPMGCAVAADVFAVIFSANGDQGLGQRVEELADSVDVISPMIYPSHYSTGWFGFECPNANPGPVVSGALDDGLPRVNGPAIVRPWIQDFTYGCGGAYGEVEVRSQIDAAEQRDLGWILWNAGSKFTAAALDPPVQ